jgi:hypothetical protein
VNLQSAITWSYLVFIALGIGLAIWGKLKPNYLVGFPGLLTFIMRHRITRIALFMVWWWIGWHFLVGVTVR